MLHDPFTFITFWIYFTFATASVNRAPFDLPEAESELVAGFMTEYSGFRWSIFMMAEYTRDVRRQRAGGHPVPGRLERARAGGELLGLTANSHVLLHLAGQHAGDGQFLVKVYVGVMFMMWLRWTLPRLRIDQVMAICLKYCVPLASIALGAASCLGVVIFRGGLLSWIRSLTMMEANPLAQRLLLPAGRWRPAGGLRRGGRPGQHRADGRLTWCCRWGRWPGCSSWPGPISSAPCN